MPTVRVFASLREAIGTSSFDVPEAGTVGEVMGFASRTYGAAFDRQLPHCTVVLNGERLGPRGLDTPVTAADEIGILPPVAGG